MSKKSLRQVTRKKPTTLESIEMVQKYAASGTDIRSSVITLAALIDVGLERLLQSKMRKLSKEELDSIFTGTAPLSGMSAKIKLSHALGLIGPFTKHDLTTINEIRNVFAHAPTSVTLRNQKVWQRASGMHVVKPFLSFTRFAKEPFTREKRLIAAMAIYIYGLNSGSRERAPRMRRTKDRSGKLRNLDGLGPILNY